MAISDQALLSQLQQFPHARRYLVAYSGGVDSHVLLYRMVSLWSGLPEDSRPALQVVHINHQLQAESANWAEHCRQQCRQLGLSLLVESVDVVGQRGSGPEDAARRARYRLFESLLEANDLLLMGHQLDDQVETLLVRLLRGAGNRGLAAMPQHRSLGRGSLLRPLLETSRQSIEDYAQQQGLQWVEDPSNNSDRYDRNYLRQQVLPQLQQRWPAYRETMARSAALSQETVTLNKELAELDFHALGLSIESVSLPIPALQELSTARLKNLLRYWLQQRGLALPSAGQLQVVLDEVIAARPDATPLLQWPGVELRRFRDEVYAAAPLPVFDAGSHYQWKIEDSGDSRLCMVGAGELLARRVPGRGLKTASTFDVQFRRGGERCQPVGRSASQSLKKLFQEYAVPVWLRDRVPLIYCAEKLVAVGDLWVCESHQATPEEEGLAISWRLPTGWTLD